MTKPQVDATADDLRATAEVLKLAAILDDRVTGADKARIVAWAEQIHRHSLQRSDLLDGLQVFYDQPSQHAIQIGDLIHHARNVKRSRLEREADAVRDARRALNDTKAADLVAGIAGGLDFRRAKRKSPRLLTAEDALQSCHGSHDSQAAIAEYFAAKAEATSKPVNA